MLAINEQLADVFLILCIPVHLNLTSRILKPDILNNGNKSHDLAFCKSFKPCNHVGILSFEFNHDNSFRVGKFGITVTNDS